MDVPEAGPPLRRRWAGAAVPHITNRTRLSTLRSAFWVALIPGAILFLAMQTFLYARANMIGADSHAYWLAARYPSLWYSSPPEYRDAYLYSPAFAQMLWPLGRMSWPAFQSVWAAGQVLVLGWLFAPLGWRKGLTLAPFCIADLLLGNLYVFFAGVLVVSLGRAPGAQALPALTKITPSFVVAGWLVVRREWRAASWAVGMTLSIVAVSVAIDPSSWLDWAHFLARSAGGGGGTLLGRLLLAAAVTLVAARTSHAWLLAPAVVLASPVLGGWVAFAVLAAIPRLLMVQRGAIGKGANAVRRPLPPIRDAPVPDVRTGVSSP